MTRVLGVSRGLTAGLWFGLFLVGFEIDAAPVSTSFRFEFGSSKPAEGWLSLSPNQLYTAQKGFGFKPRARLLAVEASGTNGPVAACASEEPFYFSVALPEGNYNVTLTFGDPLTGSTNTLKAESRRLMLERVVTRPGENQPRTVTVNVRTPRLRDGGTVRLKQREKGSLDWDDKLTLEFNGSHPAVERLQIEPVTNAVTVYLLGDSTVTDQPEEPWNSWGQMLPCFFRPGVAVANHAESGESLRSSLGARRVAKVLESLKPGDYVFAQFGHNDQKDRSTNALATYKADLTKLVADVRARGATPVLVTSMERMAGVTNDTLGPYPEAVRELAQAQHTALIDLHAMSRTLYQALGPNLKRAFQDGTHHNAYGSYELAKCVVAGIRKNNLDLARFVLTDTPAFDPAYPDPVDLVAIPPSPSYSLAKPEGY